MRRQLFGALASVALVSTAAASLVFDVYLSANNLMAARAAARAEALPICYANGYSQVMIETVDVVPIGTGGVLFHGLAHCF